MSLFDGTDLQALVVVASVHAIFIPYPENSGQGPVNPALLRTAGLLGDPQPGTSLAWNSGLRASIHSGIDAASQRGSIQCPRCGAGTAPPDRHGLQSDPRA